jgi:hypothetical protein
MSDFVKEGKEQQLYHRMDSNIYSGSATEIHRWRVKWVTSGAISTCIPMQLML